MIYVPRSKIRVITKKPENKFVQDAIDRGNMKVASIAKNIIAECGVETEEIRNAAISAYAHSRGLLSELNNLKSVVMRTYKRTRALLKKQRSCYSMLPFLLSS